MRSHTTTAICIGLLIATIVTVDLVFFRGRFRERLAVNVGLVLAFAAFYFRFLAHP